MQRLDEILQTFASRNPHIVEQLVDIYGNYPEYIESRIKCYENLARKFGDIYGYDAEVVLVRAPARVNLVGMHIDHRGGSVNPIASKEIVVVASPRDDDRVIMHNMNPRRFPPRSFVISEELPPRKIQDWTAWTQEQSDLRERTGTAGDWSNYVKAALLYLQEIHRNDNGSYHRRLSGMNLFVDGNIPIASGLASSSALVVATAEAVVALNGLNYTPSELVELCGTAEWYIGTRGGKGDHAAIKLSKRGFISHIGFFPLTVDYAPFPDDYQVVVCSSYVEAKKASGARSIFNERVATYEIGLALLKNRFSRLNGNVSYFRDLNVQNLRIDEPYLYEMVKSLPLRITREQLTKELPRESHRLAGLYKTHDEPEEGYRVRGVCLFGLAECERSKKAAEFLKKGDVEAFGRLISLSHDGDRVTAMNSHSRIAVNYEPDDKMLDELMQYLRSPKPDLADVAHLYQQPGGYAVSCEELDTLVDTACEVEGVLGAGRTGAGLGGCISVLVKAEKANKLVDTVTRQYYQPRGLKPAVEVCFPTQGAGLIF